MTTTWKYWKGCVSLASKIISALQTTFHFCPKMPGEREHPSYKTSKRFWDFNSMSPPSRIRVSCSKTDTQSEASVSVFWWQNILNVTCILFSKSFSLTDSKHCSHTEVSLYLFFVFVRLFVFFDFETGFLCLSWNSDCSGTHFVD